MNSKLFCLEDKVAVVTGAARGLGRGYAQALAGAGAITICVDIDEPNETVSLIQESGGKAEGACLDVSKPKDVKDVFDRIVEKHGKLDILVNNAGVEIPKNFLDYNEEEFDKIIGVNLRGLFFTSQAAVRHMVRQRSGKIINQGSLGSAIGLAGATVYCCSKGGVLQFTKALSVEMAPYNIQVNAIGPGYFRTSMTEPFFQDPKHKEWIESRIPMGRIGTLEDLMGVVVFLASPASDYITGQIVYVDGGWLAS